MLINSCHETPPIISVLVLFFLLFSPIFSLKDFQEENGTSTTGNTSKKIKLINARPMKINKPFVKSIKVPPELPKGYDKTGKTSEIKQLWNSKGESCPNGTIPIKRTNASDISKYVSISKFGKKYSGEFGPAAPGHEYAIGYVTQGEFYGAKGLLNVWKPNVTGNDFSLSQIWVLASVPTRPVNTVEAGWHVHPTMNKDNLPRLFIFWTPDGYLSGCYNLLCPGFVQINQKICLGASINPISTYNGNQYDIALLIWKDPKSKDWWLRVGTEVVGFWPADLFTDLRDQETRVDYGGEVYSQNSGLHTSTQMGSGHFQGEGFRKAAFARNLEVVDQDNYLNAVSNLNVFADKPNCYSVNNGYGDSWGNYIFFGGPGYNPNCV